MENVKENAPLVLVAERLDDADSSVADLLMREGYRVMSVADSDLAIFKFMYEAPTVVILDDSIPGRGIWDICKAIKEEFHGFTPVILISDRRGSEQKTESIELGADDYIYKPFDSKELLARVKWAIRLKYFHLTLETKNKELQDKNLELQSLSKQLQETKALHDLELERLTNVQATLLPEKIPDIKGYKFSAMYIPGGHASGDYYDFLQIDEDHIAVLTADVSGRGISASVVMAMTNGFLHAARVNLMEPSQVLEELNRMLFSARLGFYFVTMFYVVINIKEGIIKYANAGHDPALLVNAKQKTVSELTTMEHIPLRTIMDFKYDSASIQIEPNSRLLLYTDGLVETRAPNGDFYNIHRLKQTMIDLLELPTELCLAKLMENVDNFGGYRQLSDDVTMLLVEREAN